MVAAVERADGSPPLLEMIGVRKRFGATIALDGVDLAVRAGEIHALVGENGAGKSTLMKVLAGAERADGGTLRLAGVPFTPHNPLVARRSGVGMIYQELSLAPHLSVEQNISLGVEPARFGCVRRGAAAARARAALAQLDHADIDLHAPVRRLPIAQRQIVEIARAVASGCRVLVLDEPTSSLTGEDVRCLFGLLARLKAQGHALVYISHFLEEVKQVADRFTVLRDGRVAGHGAMADTSIERIVEMMIGRHITQLYPRSPRQPGEAVLSVRELGGSPKPLRATFDLHRGEVLGIAGLVGAGRTELLRTVFGLDAAARGDIRVAAVSGPASPAQRLRQGVGLLSEDRKGEGLATSLTVADNLTLSRPQGLGPAGIVLPALRRAASERWIRRLDIRCRGPEQAVHSLSGGNQQKVALGRLLHHDVDVLLLDEPTRGVDVASKAQIYRLIDALASGGEGRAPKAVLVVSSYLPELLGICDRIGVMHRGVLGPVRARSEWDEHSLMLEATGKEAA